MKVPLGVSLVSARDQLSIPTRANSQLSDSPLSGFANPLKVSSLASEEVEEEESSELLAAAADALFRILFLESQSPGAFDQ
uniref:Uncharacterized protein n=1 Tax=Romanomermis culicivorax TaxID=13658 RepID=A0A915L8I1_ROMCU